jgi:hypothetical protein
MTAGAAISQTSTKANEKASHNRGAYGYGTTNGEVLGMNEENDEASDQESSHEKKALEAIFDVAAKSTSNNTADPGDSAIKEEKHRSSSTNENTANQSWEKRM